MGLLYQKRRLKVNKAKRRIAANRVLLCRFRVLLSLILSIAICYCGLKVLKLPGWYIDSEKLYAADPEVLTVQGNTITPYYKIINLIRQTQLPETQIFRLSTKELEENISQLQSVKNVYVRRYWHPARLVVVLDERVPAFVMAPNLESEPTMAMTTDGVIIDHDYLPFSPQVKAKKLLTYGIKDGYEEIWDNQKVDEILKLTKAIETYSGQEIKYIDLRNPLDIYIQLGDYLIRFGEINETALSRAKWIGSILPQAKNYNQKIKYIDLRWEKTRYFRLEDDAKEQKVNENTIKPSDTDKTQKSPDVVTTSSDVEDQEAVQIQDESEMD